MRIQVEIIAGAVCEDHIHLSVAIPPKISISNFMGYLSSTEIYKRAGRRIEKKRFKRYRFVSRPATVLAIPPCGASSNISPLEG